jgi:hypothetical protein
MVFLLQSRLERLQTRVRFFLLASQEAGSTSRMLGLRFVFNAWRAHTERMRTMLIARLKRRMLGVWWRAWRKWHADQHMSKRMRQLLAELEASVDIAKVMESTPTLVRVCASPGSTQSGGLLYEPRRLAHAVFVLVDKALKEVMEDADAVKLVDMTDMHQSPDWIAR